MLFRNVAGQGIYLYAKVISTSLPDVGDAANITGTFSLDGSNPEPFGTTNPTEISVGVYFQPLAQAETDGMQYGFSWVSNTPGILIEPELGNTDVKLADGVPHGGIPGSSTATLALQAMNVTNPSGRCITILCSGSGDGINILASDGDGINSKGSNGVGVRFAGGGNNAPGVSCAASTGPGFFCFGSGGYAAFSCEGTGAGAGALFKGGSTAAGIMVQGGSISGDAVLLTATDGSGLKCEGGNGNADISAILAPNALDNISITPPSGVAGNFREMMIQSWRRLFKKSVKTVSGLTIKTYADDNTTIVTTQTFTDDGNGNETLNSAT